MLTNIQDYFAKLLATCPMTFGEASSDQAWEDLVSLAYDFARIDQECLFELLLRHFSDLPLVLVCDFAHMLIPESEHEIRFVLLSTFHIFRSHQHASVPYHLANIAKSHSTDEELQNKFTYLEDSLFCIGELARTKSERWVKMREIVMQLNDFPTTMGMLIYLPLMLHSSISAFHLNAMLTFVNSLSVLNDDAMRIQISFCINRLKCAMEKLASQEEQKGRGVTG